MDTENKKPNKRFLAILAEETETLKKEIAEAIENLGDPLDAKLNQNDKLGDSNKALVYKDKSGKEEKSKGPVTKGDNPVDVKMNQQPSKEGSDKKAATAVKVDAGAEKGGSDVTAGQATAKFTSKTDNPKKEVSEPFTDTASKEMNKMDSEKADKEAPKTFVEAGGEKGGTDVTAGQHNTNWKEKAPKSDNDKRIASGIQLKEKYTKKELQEFIMEQAIKKAKQQIFENQLKNVKKDIENL